ncbi:MAG: cyclopropane-fatty-acyl-phospholipid synthase family protein [Armatimonadetes bacterium]|nr:cyclopropane-fatty-acyl-phospholipid synthase family protein [Armatimonadota bacterium]
MTPAASSTVTNSSSAPEPSTVPRFSPQVSAQAARTTWTLLDALTPIKTGQCSIRLWDGSVFPDDAPRPCTITLHHPGSMRAMFERQDALNLAEAYLSEHFTFEGDLAALFDLSEEMAQWPMSPLKKAHLATLLFRLPRVHAARPRRWRERAHLSGRPHSIERDKAAVAYHYNVATEFYKAFLDKNMVYSCGLFAHADESLDDAQIRKLDDVCRQLNLQPGQKVLDVGCGWGGWMIHAAKNYGVQATGITLSGPQAEEANRRIKAAGLEGKCRAIVADYRELTDWESFDAIASIEMFEHVGREMLVTYFTQALKLLKKGGLFLNQGTTVETDDARRRYPAFIKQYVFPDGEVVPIHVSIRASEESGFEVLNVRSIREHYVKTCNHWVKNLELSHEKSLEYVGEPTWRVWRLYTAVSEHGFRVGRLNCYQTLMRKN